MKEKIYRLFDWFYWTKFPDEWGEHSLWEVLANLYWKWGIYNHFYGDWHEKTPLEMRPAKYR